MIMDNSEEASMVERDTTTKGKKNKKHKKNKKKHKNDKSAIEEVDEE